ncbi:hypothetical protein DFQ27_004457 [Actinomortierella ambigua]|uniref:Peptide hydrolase n=1 Tax=Actinomortierella ambigua TaxID=1343610 RepID=A0A9P6UCL5_9FUNG|nr:hypothetical protein DFQ27_004457 [Actinomortierella ambigua]
MAALVMAEEPPLQEYNWAFGNMYTETDLAGCSRQLRGLYEDLHIYAYAPDCKLAFRNPNKATFASLPATDADAFLYVIERQHLEGDVVPRDHLEWQALVRKAIDTLNHRVESPALEKLVDEGKEEEQGGSWPSVEDIPQHTFINARSRLLNRRGKDVLCRLHIVEGLTREQGAVDYRMVLGSDCAAEDVTLMLSEWLPSNAEILPVRTEGSLMNAMTLPGDHPVVEKKKRLRHRKSLQKIVDSVDPKRMEQDITWLTGEAQGSPFTTRSSTSPQSHKVAAWLLDQFEASGSCTKVEFMNHNSRFGPNVLCTIKGTTLPDELVILGAHHDSRGSFFNPRAPGANDDGSGTGMLLAVARAIHEHKVTFERTVIIAAFSGEEQGLLGSAAYARLLRTQGAKVVTMLQGDMLAYQMPGEPIQTAFPLRHHTPELTDLLVNVTQMYVPETKVGFTGACCSDHQSFFENGYPATAFFERNGPIADPKYHNSADLVYRAGYSFEELAANTKAMMASIFEMANYKSGSLDDEAW